MNEYKSCLINRIFCCCSVARSRLTLQPHGPQHARLPWPSLSHSLLKCKSIKSVMPSNHLILCHPLLLPPSISPSIRVFSCESALRLRWSKYWSFSFSISPSNKDSGLISFGLTGLISLLPKEFSSLLQDQHSKASVVRCSTFFIVQLSHPYMTTGKTIALTLQTFVSDVMSLLFKMLSR